jgi:signal transduction histidine kinase
VNPGTTATLYADLTVRARLIGVLATLMVCILFALGVPLGSSIVREHQESLFEDRVDDTARFAALAQNAMPGPPPSALSAELARYQQVYGITAAVIDRGGRPWALTRGFPANASMGVSAALREAFAGRHSVDPPTIWPWQDRTLVVAAPVTQAGDVVGAVVTVSSTRRMRAAVTRAWLLLCAAAAVALLVLLALAQVLAVWMLRPVRALDTVTHTIAMGRLDARVGAATGPPELRRLTASFNEMARQVESVLERQRAFVADASHQLRNPLSAVMLRLEDLALALPVAHEDEVQEVKREAYRLTRILDDLLDLALAEQNEEAVQAIDVAALVEERVTAWQVVAQRRGIRLTYGWERAVTGMADPTGLGSALDAVVDNALKFSPGHSQVGVQVRETGTEVEIRVTDEGSGLSPEELNRIGDRFWRSPRHQNVDGSGLGLAVARTLLSACGGRLDVAAAGESGLVVTMAVPAVTA